MVEREVPKSRADFEAALDRLVRGNRFTIAVVFPLVGAALFVASHQRWDWIPPWLLMNPLLVLFGTLVMRLPLVAGFAPLVNKRAAGALFAVFGYAYAVEFVGVHYGVPYGDFSYQIELGPMLAGVPVGLPVFFVPLVLNSYLLTLLLLGPRTSGTSLRSRAVRVLASLALVLVVDLVLDPAAVGLGFWVYDGGGVYYGVPWTNYAGWVLSGLVAVLLIEFGFDSSRLTRRLDRCPFMLDDFVSFVLLWGAMNVYFQNWVPVALAVALLGGLVRADRFDFVSVGRKHPEQG